ncbi:FMN-dependent NADH-azoreductase [Sneathiella glossodoripedis]|uniref:FMN-dependent NADH-azoreductase n=1 Tax=Sneathiella glossodoripedis TaxID=418853 RepID=UPI0004722625|nr:NAD(P)H-dependent oxidoreductase [Sneathiella glossodoripedis]
MKTILHIDASARKTDNPVAEYNSISKSIASTFIKNWQALNNEDNIIYRDVGANPPDFISQDWIAAVFTPDASQTDTQKSLLSLSDTLIKELEQADIIAMSTSMYNYGMPASLKAWFDQVIRVHKTFSFDLARGDFPLEPTLSGKTLVLITSCGEFGFAKGGIREKMNHLTPHIKTLSRYLGVETVHEITAEYQEFNDGRHKLSVQNAHIAAENLAQELSIRNQ